jgi:hypothetical protein
MTKTELLALTRSERAALDDVFAKPTDDELCATVLDGGWSMKDALAHITAWEQRVLRAAAATARGERDVWPEPGYTLADVDRLNERDYLANHDRALADVRAEARASFEAYLRWIDGFSDAQIAADLPAASGVSLENIIRANGDEHYREHLDAIEAWWAGQGA